MDGVGDEDKSLMIDDFLHSISPGSLRRSRLARRRPGGIRPTRAFRRPIELKGHENTRSFTREPCRHVIPASRRPKMRVTVGASLAPEANEADLRANHMQARQRPSGILTAPRLRAAEPRLAPSPEGPLGTSELNDSSCFPPRPPPLSRAVPSPPSSRDATFDRDRSTQWGSADAGAMSSTRSRPTTRPRRRPCFAPGLSLLLCLALLAAPALASVGDRLPEFVECVEVCLRSVPPPLRSF